MFPQLHTLLPVRQEVCDPPVGGIGHVELGEPDLKQSWEDRIKGRAEIHKQDSGICSWGVQMLEGVVQSHVYCIVYRPVGSVGELQGVQEWDGYGFQVGQHKALNDFMTTEVRATGL